MVCAIANNKIAKSSTKGIKKRQRPIDKEYGALRTLVPGSSKKSDLELVLDAISYIKQLEEKLGQVSTPALLKAQFIALENMKGRQPENWTKISHGTKEDSFRDKHPVFSYCQ